MKIRDFIEHKILFHKELIVLELPGLIIFCPTPSKDS